jgi:hypothetical protein
LDVPLSLTNIGLTIICTLIYISRLEPNNRQIFLLKKKTHNIINFSYVSLCLNIGMIKEVFLKQNPPKTNQPSVGAGTSTTEKYESTTPTAGKITLEELEEKQRSGQRLTLIERRILLAHEVKKKQTQ